MQPCPSSATSSTFDLQPLKYGVVAPKCILVTEAIESFVIGTYNVLFPQPFIKGKFSSSAGYSVTSDNMVIPNDTWRRQIKIMNILTSNPNCLALQEVTQDEFDEYQSKLTGYSGMLCLHPNAVHGVAIFYKTAEFHLIGAIEGAFHQQIVKNNKDGSLTTFTKSRVHLIADLQDKLSGMILRIVSCHLFDPRDQPKEKKCRHLEAVVTHANIRMEYALDMTAICGDLNQDQYGDDVTLHLKENAKAVGWQFISAFGPFIGKYGIDNNLRPTEYQKDLSKVDGEMISTKRKTDWIFIKIGNSIHEFKNKGIVLKSGKYPNLMIDEHDLRGSDHALTLTRIETRRTFF